MSYGCESVLQKGAQKWDHVFINSHSSCSVLRGVARQSLQCDIHYFQGKGFFRHTG